MKIVNYTPHTVTVLGCDYPSVGIARVLMREVRVDTIGAIPVFEEHPGPVTGLPEPAPGVYYLVSRLVAAALPERGDLVFPARVQRDAHGRPSGCDALARVTPAGGTVRMPTHDFCGVCRGAGTATGVGGDSGYEGPCHYGPYGGL